MCGIVGFWDVERNSKREALNQHIQTMRTKLQHRGPDSGGDWSLPEDGIALGHQRLAIIDLSPLGAQPMASTSGRYHLTFNGEIYNYRTLKEQLYQQGCTFRSESDTEVLLSAIEEWGVEKTLQELVGMFAFGLWDRSEKKLILARDRFGEKPLYYGWCRNTFLFGSELKSIKCHPHWQSSVNQGALSLFLRHNYIPAPYSIYNNIYKLLPGSYLEISDIDRHPTPKQYWSAHIADKNGLNTPFQGDLQEATKQLEYLLLNSIADQMISDVPLGAFLSGGIDSSAVVALMQKCSSVPVRTFSIGFEDPNFNEAEHAKSVAAHLGTQHEELYVTQDEMLKVVPKLPSLYDEPFADSSQIPTFLVSKLTRQHVTVALSGDGGDEVFGGYARYGINNDLWHKLQYLPKLLRIGGGEIIASILSTHPVGSGFTTNFFGKNIRKWINSEQLSRLESASLLLTHSGSPYSFYRRNVSHTTTPSEWLVKDVAEPETNFMDISTRLPSENMVQLAMLMDTVTYLPDDILVKVDRASMGVALETRVPFLDHRVYEFAWSLPLHMKYGANGETKKILRRLLYKYVPKELVERPKTGFGVPLAEWLRGPLHEWAEDLLSPSKLNLDGVFITELVRALWEDFSLHHHSRHHAFLWNILMFQAWSHENNGS